MTHEEGNYITFPRANQVRAYRHNVKPYWLTVLAAKMETLGKSGEWERWATASERLFLLCHKLNTEALRLNPVISGYQLHMLTDYWCYTGAILDVHSEPKGITAPEVRRFNAAVVLLQRGMQAVYPEGGDVAAAALVSNCSEDTIQGGELAVEVLAGERPLWRQVIRCAELAQGALTAAGRVSVRAAAVRTPAPLAVRATLSWADQTIDNAWSGWVFPAAGMGPELRRPLYAAADLHTPLQPFAPKPLPSGDAPLPADAVYVGTALEPRVLDAVAAGASAVLLTPAGLFESVPQRFKPGWWDCTEIDTHSGTVAADHPVLRDFAPEGWCDWGWYRLLEGATAFILNAPSPAPEILLRSLNAQLGPATTAAAYNTALLFEARVGRGRLFVSGLNFGLTERPLSGLTLERRYLLERILEHGDHGPKPAGEWPVADLRHRLAVTADTTSALAWPVEGFAEGSRCDGELGMLDGSGSRVLRLLQRGAVLEWQTAPVGSRPEAQTAVTFVFCGGLGWTSQPKTDGFALLVDDREVLRFDVATEHTHWSGSDACLEFEPWRGNSEDASGVFRLTIPARLAPSEGPVKLAVHSVGAGSNRWFCVTDNPVAGKSLRLRYGLEPPVPIAGSREARMPPAP